MKRLHLFRRCASPAGFSVLELVTVMTVTGVLLMVGFASMRDYARKHRAQRATQAVAWSVQVARSYAIRAGRPMSLIIDETKRQALVRDTTGMVAYRRDFGPNSEFRLKRLDLDVDGDSLTFSRRGLCMNCQSGGPTNFYIEALDKKYTIEVGLLGRTEMKVRN